MKANTFQILVILVGCFTTQLFSANEQAPAKAIVSKVKGLGLVLNAFQTPDGYVSLSKVNSYGYAVVLRKTSNSGQRILEKKISIGAPLNYGNLTGFAQTVDGYVFVGEKQYAYGYYGRGNYGFLFKLNKNGVFQWGKNFNFNETGTSSPTTIFETIISKPDGGFVVIGRQYQPTSILLLSFTSNGESILWTKSIRNFLTDTYTYYSQRVSDGIILTSGRKILKINDSGDIVWKKRLKIEDFRISSLGFSPADNGVVIAGNLGISAQLMLVHLGANGEVDWTQTYSFSIASTASTLLRTSDGGYLISGRTMKGGAGGEDGMLLKINAKRDVVLCSSFGGPGNQKVHLVFAKNGGYILIGSSSADMLIAGLNSDGIVPGCSLVDSLIITKVASPPVTAEEIGIVSGSVLLKSPETIGIHQADSQRPTVSMCQ
jgi:outer membrane protein assembly factor BamB